MSKQSALPRKPNRLDAIAGLPAFNEQAMAMIVSLASEVAMLRARLDSCERLLASTGVLPPDAIDTFEPDAAAQAERERQRVRLLKKVFRPLQEAAEAELASVQSALAQAGEDQ